MWSDWIGPWPGIASRMSSADSQTHGNQKMQRGQTSETHIMRQSKKKKKKSVFCFAVCFSPQEDRWKKILCHVNLNTTTTIFIITQQGKAFRCLSHLGVRKRCFSAGTPPPCGETVRSAHGDEFIISIQSSVLSPMIRPRSLTLSHLADTHPQ